MGIVVFESMAIHRRLEKSLFSTGYNRFLELLRNARLTAGLTQAEAAHHLQKPQSFISKCESGERKVDVVELIEFCRVYDTDPSEIVRELENHARSRKKAKRT